MNASGVKYRFYVALGVESNDMEARTNRNRKTTRQNICQRDFCAIIENILTNSLVFPDGWYLRPNVPHLVELNIRHT